MNADDTEPMTHGPAVEQSPSGWDEPFKRVGCTLITILVVFFLLCSIVYFFTGLAAMFVHFWETMTRPPEERPFSSAGATAVDAAVTALSIILRSGVR